MEAAARERAPFYRVSCPDCSNKQIVFSRAATKVACHTCGTTIAEPTGGRAKVSGEILESFN